MLGMPGTKDNSETQKVLVDFIRCERHVGTEVEERRAKVIVVQYARILPVVERS